MSGERIDLSADDSEALTLDATAPEQLDVSPAAYESVVLDVLGAEPVTLEASDAQSVDVALRPAETLSLDVSTTSITLDVGGLIGPRGPAGPAGGGGSGGSSFYRHPQAAPSSLWLVEHGLGYRPAVNVEDSAGSKVEGDVTYVDENTLTIRFSAAFGGYANLS